MALNRVQVVVVGALDLPAMDRKTSDPYVKFQYRGKEYRTATLKKTLQPKWNYTVEFAYNKVFGPHLLYLEVWDANVLSSDKLIGRATLSMESLELNKAVDKWYPLEHVAKAQDSATLRVKMTLLPPLSEASPNAGEGQKVVVMTHGRAQAAVTGNAVYPPSSLPNLHQPAPCASPPVYPMYAALPPPPPYNPPVSPPCGYPPVAQIPFTHPPPFGNVVPHHPPPCGYPPSMVSCASPSQQYVAVSPYVSPAPPPEFQPESYAYNCPHKAGGSHKRTGKKDKEKKESSSSGSDSGTEGVASDAVSKKGKKSRSKPQVVKMEITLPSL